MWIRFFFHRRLASLKTSAVSSPARPASVYFHSKSVKRSRLVNRGRGAGAGAASGGARGSSRAGGSVELALVESRRAAGGGRRAGSSRAGGSVELTLVQSRAAAAY